MKCTRKKTLRCVTSFGGSYLWPAKSSIAISFYIKPKVRNVRFRWRCRWRRLHMHFEQSWARAVVVRRQPKCICRIQHISPSVLCACGNMACICDLRAMPNILTDHFTHHSSAHRFQTSSSFPHWIFRFLFSFFFALARDCNFYLACLLACIASLRRPYLFHSHRPLFQERKTHTRRPAN